MMDYPPITNAFRLAFLNFTQGGTGLLTIALDVDGGECYRQLEQCGHDSLRRWLGSRVTIFVYPASTDRFDGIRPWNPPEAIRDGIRLRIRTPLKNLGQLNVVNTTSADAEVGATGATTRTHWRTQTYSWGNCSINLRPEQ